MYCFLTIMSRFFKNHFQMVWGEGRFLSELPREAPEVGGLDNRDPESSIICWLSTAAVLQIIHRSDSPSHPGEKNRDTGWRQKDREPTPCRSWDRAADCLWEGPLAVTPAPLSDPQGAGSNPRALLRVQPLPASRNLDLGNECHFTLLMFLFLFQK